MFCVVTNSRGGSFQLDAGQLTKYADTHTKNGEAALEGQPVLLQTVEV